MESAPGQMNFGRQPEPVLVILEGNPIDVEYWLGQLRQRAEFKGDVTVRVDSSKFRIHPRAVND